LELVAANSDITEEYVLQFMDSVTTMPWALALLTNLSSVPDISLFQNEDSESWLGHLMQVSIQNCVDKYPQLRIILEMLAQCNPDFPLPLDLVEAYWRLERDGSKISLHRVPEKSQAILSHESTDCGIGLPSVPLFSLGMTCGSTVPSVHIHKALHLFLQNYSLNSNQGDGYSERPLQKSWFSLSNQYNEGGFSNLPGVQCGYLGGKPGILTLREFSRPKLRMSRDQYLQLVSCHHVILESIMRSAKMHSKVPCYIQALVPHIYHIVEKGQLSTPTISLSDQARGLSFLGVALREQDTFNSANLCRRAVEMFQELNGHYHLTVAESLKNEAITLYRNNQLQRARSRLESTLQILQKIPQRFDNSAHLTILADTLSLLGVVLTALKDWSESKEIFAQALHLHRLIPLSESNTTLFNISITMSDLGLANLHCGDLHFARKLLEECLESHRRSNDHIESIRTMHILSHVYALLGRADQVQKLERELRT
jgi:tetratricopeptide (TPR) repeat protein